MRVDDLRENAPAVAPLPPTRPLVVPLIAWLLLGSALVALPATFDLINGFRGSHHPVVFFANAIGRIVPILVEIPAAVGLLQWRPWAHRLALWAVLLRMGGTAVGFGTIIDLQIRSSGLGTSTIGTRNLMRMMPVASNVLAVLGMLMLGGAMLVVLLKPAVRAAFAPHNNGEGRA
jgi:hypothetical protein